MSSPNEPSPPEPAEPLDPKLKERLETFASSILVDKITVSFSVEDRNAEGQKKSVFMSLNAMCDPNLGPGYSVQEMDLARVILGRRLVHMVYEDAFLRRVLPHNEAYRTERDTILELYSKKAQILMKALKVEGKEP